MLTTVVTNPAHYDAWKAGVIHRDISAGNVLIRITETIEDGKYVRKREGILADWELSTVVMSGDITDSTRAIDRTVSSFCFSYPGGANCRGTGDMAIPRG